MLLIFVFSSSQFGALRYPFRFLPVWAMMASAVMMVHLETSTFHFSKQKLYQFSGLVLCAAFIQLFSAEAVVFKSKNIIFALLFILLCISLVAYFFKYKENYKKINVLLWLVTVLAWVGMLAQIHSPTKYRMAYHPNLTAQVSGMPAKLPSYYVLGLTPNAQSKALDITDLGSVRFLLYGQNSLKSINGYSPIGHVGFQRLLPNVLPWGEFIAPETLKNISAPSELQSNIFDYQLLNIGAISAWKKDVTPDIFTLLTQAGLLVTPYTADKLLIKPRSLRPTEGSLTYQTLDGSIKLDHEDGMMQEWFTVTKTNVDRTLIFSRLFWPGYHAVINGNEYPVSHYKNTLLKVIIPAGISGKMHLYYEPVSWKYTKWSLVLGVVLLGITFRFCRSP